MSDKSNWYLVTESNDGDVELVPMSEEDLSAFDGCNDSINIDKFLEKYSRPLTWDDFFPPEKIRSGLVRRRRKAWSGWVKTGSIHSHDHVLSDDEINEIYQKHNESGLHYWEL